MEFRGELLIAHRQGRHGGLPLRAVAISFRSSYLPRLWAMD